MGILLSGYFYAIRYLPIGDVMMISSIKPAIVTLLSCIFLKEACGVTEILNLLLTLTGIFLVVQPSMVFGDTTTSYTNHMTYAALGLLVANIVGSCVNVIVRYMRHVHWTALALSSRIVVSTEMLVVCSVCGFLCVPDCGYDRAGVVVLVIVAIICQFLSIRALQLEQANVVSLVENSGSIVVSLLLQIIIFQDIPNLIKILGALLTLLSILVIGVQRILKERRLVCRERV